MAKDAGAVYKLNKLVLVNCDIFAQYLETFRLSDLDLQSLVGFSKVIWGQTMGSDPFLCSLHWGLRLGSGFRGWFWGLRLGSIF